MINLTKKCGWIDDARIYVHTKIEVEQNFMQEKTKKRQNEHTRLDRVVLVVISSFHTFILNS
jgi:hypothetical protein